MPKPRTAERMRERHALLHKNLDELLGCFLLETKKNPVDVTLMDFMAWSFEMTTLPTCVKSGEDHG